MRILTLAGLAAAGAGAWWWLHHRAASPSATALTVVPLPATAQHILSVAGYDVFEDPADGAYYARQGNSPYVLPLTRANVDALLLGQFKPGGNA